MEAVYASEISEQILIACYKNAENVYHFNMAGHYLHTFVPYWWQTLSSECWILSEPHSFPEFECWILVFC